MSRLPVLLLPLLFSLAACTDKADDSGDDSGATSDGGAASDGGSGSDGGSTGTDEDADGWSVEDGDCDDSNADVNPDRIETCDGVDEDCDGQTDEDAGGYYYTDDDGDGYGSAADPLRSCDPISGAVDNGADCDDTDSSVYPGATETGNGVDDDCDDEVDEGVASFSVDVSWSSAGVDVTISGGGGSYEFGMAETGAGRDGWYGETCIDGDEPDGLDDYGYDVCHSLNASGGEVESVYPNVSSVRDGSTLFNEDIGDSGDLTYALFATSGSDCWVWGDDPSYYDDFGCSEL